MQAIERYGVVALLLLIGTVVAVLVWDGAPTSPDAMPPDSRVAYAEEPAMPYDAAARQEPGRIGLSGRPENRALGRDIARESSQDLASSPASGGLVETTPRREEEAWAPPADSYRPARRGQETSEFYANEQPEYYEPAPADLEPFTPYEQEVRPRIVERAQPGPAPVASERPASGTAKGRRYKIQSGDTLGQISLDQLGTSKRWREIVELNPGLNPARLFVGKEILLPAAANLASTASSTQPAASAKAAPKAVAGPTYTVQNGDNLWKIAELTLGNRERWHEIRDLNPSIDPDKILVGQKLALPADPRTVREPIVASSANTGTRQPRRVR